MSKWETNIPSIFDYEDLGMNNSCVHDFITTVYRIQSLDPVGFNPDSADIFKLICNGGARSIKKPSAKKVKQFQLLCKGKTPFIFAMQAIGLDCSVLKTHKELASRKTVLVWYVDPLLKEIEAINVDLPLVSNWVFRMLGLMEDLVSDKDDFKANMAGVSSAFINKHQFSSISLAYVVYMCTWYAYRFNFPLATYEEISKKVLDASDITLKENLTKFNTFLDRWIKDQGCVLPQVYHLEKNTCVDIKELQGHLINKKPKVDVRFGASVVKGKSMDSEFAIGEGTLTFALNTADTLAALLLETPNAISTPINLEDHTVVKASWEQQFWTLPPEAQTPDTYNKRILVWPKQIVETIKFGLLHPGVQFIVIPLIVKDTVSFGEPPVPDAHSNLLIYDKVSKTWERWEPHGTNVYDMFEAEDYPGMETAIKEELSLFRNEHERIGKIDWTYISPDQSCPWVVVGKDFFQRDERGYLLRDDDEGLCETWSFWYLYTKLKNPGVSQKELLAQARDAFKSMLGTKVFIRRFKSFLDSITVNVSHMSTFTFYEELKNKQKRFIKQSKDKQTLPSSLTKAPFTFQYELGQNNTVFFDWVKKLFAGSLEVAPEPLVFTITSTSSSVDFSPFTEWYDDLKVFLVRCVVKLPDLKRTVQFVGLADCESDNERFEIYWPDLPLLTELKILNKIEYELSDRFDPIYAVTLPYAFIDKWDFPSASIAYLPWLLCFIQSRHVLGLSYSSDEIAVSVMETATASAMEYLVNDYLTNLSNYYKAKCKPPKILHPELDSCVEQKELVKLSLDTSPVKIKYGASVVKGKPTKLVDENDFYIPVDRVTAYILLHYPYVGSSIPNIVTGVYKSVTWKPIAPVANERDKLSPDATEFVLKWGNDITNMISKVLADPTKRFILIDCTLIEAHTQEQADNDEVEGHSNIFLFDKATNEFEIWEPWGNFKAGLESYHTDKFYLAVKEKVNALIREGIFPPNTKVELSIDTCPVQLPSFQTSERVDYLESDDEGLCLTWSYWYLETRLKNPNIPRKTLIKEALKAFTQMVGTKAFIRRYREILVGYGNFFNGMSQEEFVEMLQTIYATLPEWKKNPIFVARKDASTRPIATPISTLIPSTIQSFHEPSSPSPKISSSRDELALAKVSLRKADCSPPVYKWIVGKGCFEEKKIDSLKPSAEKSVVKERLTKMVKLKMADCLPPKYKWVKGKGCFEVGEAKPYSPVEVKVNKTKTECVPDPPFRWTPANKALGIARGYCTKAATGMSPKKSDCKIWLARPTVDPITLDTIDPSSERYKELQELCGIPNLIFTDATFVLGKAANDGNCFFDSISQLIVDDYSSTSAVELRTSLADNFTFIDYVEVNGGMNALELVADYLPSPELVTSGKDIIDQIEDLDDDDKETVMDLLMPEWEAQKEELGKDRVWAEDWMIGFASKQLRRNIFIFNDAANQFYLTIPFNPDWLNIFVYNFDQTHFVPLRTSKRKKSLKTAEIPNIIAGL